MDLNYSTKNLFPVPIHIFDVNGFNEIKNQLIDYAYDLKKKDPEGATISNRGGWQSSGFSISDKDDVLHSFLINCLSLFPTMKKTVRIKAEAWVNINKPGDYNVKHQHPDCNLSGVLWIKCPENCGNIEFDNPNVFQTYMGFENKVSKENVNINQLIETQEIDSYTDDFKDKSNTYPAYGFPPTEGRILIFPAYLEHQVRKNKSNEDRISVSFNIQID